MGRDWSTSKNRAIAWMACVWQQMLKCILCSRWNERGLRYILCLCWPQRTFWPRLLGIGLVSYILCTAWHGIILIDTCWEAFRVHAGMGGVCQHELIYILCPHLHRICSVNISWRIFFLLPGMRYDSSTHVEIYFVSLQAWDFFVQHKLSYILCPCWSQIGLFYASWDILWKDEFRHHMLRCFLCSLCYDLKLWYTFCHRWHGRGFAYKFWNAYCVHAGMGRVLRLILCLSWHVKSWYYTFSCLAGMGMAWSTRVGIHFLSSLSLEAFGKERLIWILLPSLFSMGWEECGPHMLRSVLYLCWYGRCLGCTCWGTFFV